MSTSGWAACSAEGTTPRRVADRAPEEVSDHATRATGSRLLPVGTRGPGPPRGGLVPVGADPPDDPAAPLRRGASRTRRAPRSPDGHHDPATRPRQPGPGRPDRRERAARGAAHAVALRVLPAGPDRPDPARARAGAPWCPSAYAARPASSSRTRGCTPATWRWRGSPVTTTPRSARSRGRRAAGRARGRADDPRDRPGAVPLLRPDDRQRPPAAGPGTHPTGRRGGRRGRPPRPRRRAPPEPRCCRWACGAARASSACTCRRSPRSSSAPAARSSWTPPRGPTRTPCGCSFSARRWGR